MSEPLFQPRNDLQARLLGFFALAGGLALLRWQLIGTIEDAKAGQPNLVFSLALIAFGEMFAALGVYWLLRGLAGYQHIRTLQADPAGKKKIMLISLFAIGLTYIALTQIVSKYGYES